MQTDATTDVKGWIRWVKATGTGNTGWQAGPEADTGWRNIAAESLSNSWAVYVTMFRVRRIGKTVFMVVYLDAAAATASEFYTLPAGFRPATFTTGVSIAGANNVGLLEVTSTGAMSNIYYAPGIYFLTASWTSDAAWPTSLPGSAA